MCTKKQIDTDMPSQRNSSWFLRLFWLAVWTDPVNILNSHQFCGEEGTRLGQQRCLTPSGPTHLVRLADYLPAHPRDLVMKIDVEGSEPNVLRGAGTGRARACSLSACTLP